MNAHEIERIADAMNRLRPDWPVKQLRTLLGSPALVTRPRRDVTVALAWVACESSTANPYRVLESGPWWRAAAVDDTSTHHHAAKVYGWNEGDPRTICGICGLERGECQRRANTNGHEFVARTECLPPLDTGAFGARSNLACGVQIIGGAFCRLRNGHDGDHALHTPPPADHDEATDETPEEAL